MNRLSKFDSGPNCQDQKTIDPIEKIKANFGMDDNDLFMLFGVNKEIHYKMLKFHPEWQGAVKEMEAIY